MSRISLLLGARAIFIETRRYAIKWPNLFLKSLRPSFIVSLFSYADDVILITSEQNMCLYRYIVYVCMK